jgi:hypothetical protein
VAGLAAPGCSRALPRAQPVVNEGPTFDPVAVYLQYLDQRPQRFKMRHQVASRFGSRTEMFEGVLIVERPDRFFVQASRSFGPALFELTSVPPAPLVVRSPVDELGDRRFSHFLARDIRRIYLEDCPKEARVVATGTGLTARCALDPERAADLGGESDDALEMRLDARRHLAEKRFFAGSKPSTTIRYTDYRAGAEQSWAHHIVLTSVSGAYDLTIVLLGVEEGWETGTLPWEHR